MQKQVNQTRQHRQGTHKSVDEKPQGDFKSIFSAHGEGDEVNRNQGQLPKDVKHQSLHNLFKPFE